MEVCTAFKQNKYVAQVLNFNDKLKSKSKLVMNIFVKTTAILTENNISLMSASLQKSKI